MDRDEMVQSSRYLRVIPRQKDFAIYHSLFGGVCIVDRGVLRMLEMFQSPMSLGDVMIDNKGLSEELVKSFMELFISRRFLVNPDSDEYEPIKQKMDRRKEHLERGRQIGVVQLVVTNLCNFRCEYCFVNTIYSSDKRFELESSKDNKIMTPEIADLAIRQGMAMSDDSDRKSLHVQFFGGEPLLNWKVIKFVLDTYGDGSAHGIDIGYSIVTNGSLINEEMAEYFERHKVPVIVSYDSPRGKHRIPKKGEIDLSAVERGLSILQEFGNRIVFNSVLSEETFDNFDRDLVDFALECGVSEIGVLLDLNPEFYENRSSKDIVDRLWNVYKYGKEKGVIVTGYWHTILQQMVAYDRLKDRGYKTCSATGCQLSIEPSGDVFACKGSSGYFGHISRPGELLSSETYRKYAMRAFRNAPECEGCEIENFCSGFCLGPLEKKHNDIVVVEENTCEVYKETTRRFLKDLEDDEVDSFFLSELET